MSWAPGRHAVKFGVNFIHEPVLGGAFPDNTETLYQLPQNPTYYLNNPAQFTSDLNAAALRPRTWAEAFRRMCSGWRSTHRIRGMSRRTLTFNYGFRYSTTFGLLDGVGPKPAFNPGYITLRRLDIPLVPTAPHDDRKQFAPRLGFAYSPGASGRTVVRGGFGLYFNDLAQTGWATAFQAVNAPPGPCVDPVQNPDGP